MQNDQQVKNIAIALKDFDPKVITAIATFSTHQDPSQVRKTVKNVLRSSQKVKLSAMETQEVTNLLSTSFAQFKEEEWDLEKELGKGSYGVVSLMKSKTSTRKIATKKFLNRNGINHDIIREIGCYSLLIAARVPMYMDIVQGISFEENKISIGLKLADGTLYDYATKINQKRRIEVFGDVYSLATNCLAYLHECDIIHADIKSRNMLAWWDENLEITKLIIADFGLASSRPDRIAYTPGFKAPEILDNDYEDSPLPDKSTDVWAMGMTLIEFLTKKTWDYTYEADEVPWNIVDQTGYGNQIRSMLNHTPSERLKLEEPLLIFPERDWSSNLVFTGLGKAFSKTTVSTATFVQAVDILCRFAHIANPASANFNAALIIASKWGEFEPLTYKKPSDREIEREMLSALKGLVFFPGLEGLIENINKLSIPHRKMVWDQFVPDPIAFNEIVKNSQSLPTNETLSEAIFDDNVEQVKQLLDKHTFDHDTIDENFSLAISEQTQPEIVKLLLEHGADPTTDNNFAIKWYSEQGNLEMIKLLFEYGAYPSIENNYPIRMASKNGHKNVVKLLLDTGVKPTADIIQVAKENGHNDIVKLLQNADSTSANVNKNAIRTYIENSHDDFVLGVGIDPKINARLGNLTLFDTDLKTLPYPTSDDDWGDPQVIFGYEEGKLMVRLETYQDARSKTVFNLPITLNSAVNMITNLHNQGFMITNVDGTSLEELI